MEEEFLNLHEDLMTLEIGEAFLISNNEGKIITPPYAIIKKVSEVLQLKFEYGRMPDGSGWLVRRVG